MSLVAELEVDDDEVDRALKILGLQLRLGQAAAMARRDPAFLLVALTHAGMRGWEEGTFYDKVAALLGVTKKQAEAATAEFPKALRRLGLPTFEDAPGMRWVTPVLLHGAVPLDHLDELLDLLAIRRRRDPSLTGDSFVEWARLSSRELASWPRALTRFLELGGDFAPDFVGRVIDLVDGQDVILPRRSIERLRDVLATGRGQIAARREARPTIALTWDGTLVVRLPPVVPVHGRAVTWRLRLGDSDVERVAEVPWDERRHRTAAMTVELGRPLRDVAVERDGSAAVIPFVRKEDPLLVFDADGDLVPPTRPVSAGRITLAWPDDGSPGPVRRGDRPLRGRGRDAPYGWEGWRLLDVDLEAGEAVRLGAAQWHRVSGADRARVVSGEVVPGLLTTDGHEVTRTRPVVQLPVEADPSDWMVVVVDSDGHELERLIPDTPIVKLLSREEQPVVADLVVTVRGPLGRGVSRRVVVAEGAFVTAAPEHRALAHGGGLEEARVRIVSADGRAQEVTLGRREARGIVGIRSRQFVVEVPHVSYSLVKIDMPGPWSSEPVSIELGAIVTSSLRFRGLPAGQVPRLTFAAGADRQEVLASSARRTSTEFSLKAFADLVARAGSGAFLLQSGEAAVPVAHVRPPRLASGITLEGDVIHADAEVMAPLELIVFRHAAPWIPGRVLALDPNGTRLPADLVGLGNLRAEVRTVDEWLPQPVDTFPRPGRDVVDLSMSWDASREPEEHRAVSRVLMGQADDPGEVVTPFALARALDALGSPEVGRREQLAGLLSARPRATLEAVMLTRATTSQVVQALVEAGLVASAVDELDCPDYVKSLLGRSPLAALLAASARVATESGRNDMPGALLATELGEDLDLLWSGAPDDAALGRLEPEFAERPEMVKLAFDYLSPVPGRTLDADTRIESVYELWQARSRLAEVSKSAMATIAVSRRVIDGHDPRLWAMVEARLSRDGVIALPALTIALALVARLAAHCGGDAARASLDRRRQYGKLARHAPGLVAIDLIRADAAVIGALL